MTAEQKRRTVARWLAAGVPWRTWTARETTWVLYEELVDDLYRSGQIDALREFLEIAGDRSRLGALDREKMGQTGGVTPEPTPALRGR